MPLYFAYGANMDIEAMGARCPRSRPLTAARLMRHRLAVMREGWLTVVGDPRGRVHGVLWELALADVAALDRFEEVARGLYAKTVQPVVGDLGPRNALVYFGANAGPGGRRRLCRRRAEKRRAVGASRRRLHRPARSLRRRGGRRPLRGVGGRRARPTRASALRHAVRPGLNGPSPAGAAGGLMRTHIFWTWLAV